MSVIKFERFLAPIISNILSAFFSFLFLLCLLCLGYIYCNFLTVFGSSIFVVVVVIVLFASLLFS